MNGNNVPTSDPVFGTDELPWLCAIRPVEDKHKAPISLAPRKGKVLAVH
jgi:hypothetical protein